MNIIKLSNNPESFATGHDFLEEHDGQWHILNESPSMIRRGFTFCGVLAHPDKTFLAIDESRLGVIGEVDCERCLADYSYFKGLE